MVAGKGSDVEFTEIAEHGQEESVGIYECARHVNATGLFNSSLEMPVLIKFGDIELKFWSSYWRKP